jgi:glycosyltransferase involved in cell wall biosynthesis
MHTFTNETGSMKRLRFANLTMQTRGGAGMSALKLHEALLREGHDSKLYVAHHTIFKDKAIKIPTKKRYKQSWWNLGTIQIDESHHNIVSSGYAGTDEEFIQKAVKDADITILRWITAAVSDYQIARLRKPRKPLLWVLSDMAPFTGGCHYSNDCNKYQSNCFPCPLLPNPKDRRCQLAVLRRKRLWKNIHVIAPSEWIAEKAKSSTIFSDTPIHVVRTGVELDVYYPSERLRERERAGLRKDDIVILFGADSASDPRKGFALIEPALSILKSCIDNDRQVVAIVFGSNSENTAIRGVKTISLGTINPENKERLRDIYSSADLTLLPYIEDNLPNVMLESLACGTPVVCFSACGMKDVIHNSINGWLAAPFDPRSLAMSMLKCISNPIPRQAVRQWATLNLDVSTQAQKTIEIATMALQSNNFPPQISK